MTPVPAGPTTAHPGGRAHKRSAPDSFTVGPFTVGPFGGRG